MKRLFICITIMMFVFAFSRVSFSGSQGASQTHRVRPLPHGLKPLSPGVHEKMERAMGEKDLEATINWKFVRWKNPATQWEAIVEIIGTVRNLGSFQIGCWGAPSVYLIEEVPGERTPRYLAHQLLPNPVPPRYTYTLRKQVSILLSNEFPSTFKMVIESDPDEGCAEKTWANNIAELKERTIIRALEFRKRLRPPIPSNQPKPTPPPMR